MVHHCMDGSGQAMRYTVALTLADKGAEWMGRVWNGNEYLGEIHGEGTGPQSNYVELARMHIESQIKCNGEIRRQRAVSGG